MSGCPPDPLNRPALLDPPPPEPSVVLNCAGAPGPGVRLPSYICSPAVLGGLLAGVDLYSTGRTVACCVSRSDITDDNTWVRKIFDSASSPPAGHLRDEATGDIRAA